MLFNCPISVQKAELIISILKVNASSKVIDIGCGEGEFLARIQKASGADCLGIDIDSSCIALAEKKAQQHDLGQRLRFLLADAREFPLENNHFELALCMGSTHVFGEGRAAYANALKNMADWVAYQGLILVGEGYWKQHPEQEYLDFIGDPVGIYNSHEDNIQQAESLGLIPLYAAVSNQDEWDHFEWCFRIKMERQALENPDCEITAKKLERIREWNRYYRKFGRTTMGFGFYLFMNV